MDALQTARMIEWLDEERRRDKATIAQLEERNTQQQETLDQLKRHLNGLENELTHIRSQYMPANRDQELMQLLRNEFNQVVEGLEAKRLTAEREAERRNEIMRETMLTPIRKLEDQHERMTESVRDILGVRTERDRMAAAIAAMQQRVEEFNKRLEDPERRITLLEEQRRQDSRRLSDVQSTLPDLQKSIDQLNTKIDLLEALTKANEKRMIELQTSESARREEIQLFLDQQNLISQQREQQVNDIRQRVTAYDDDMRRNLERFEAWSETHRQMRKVVDDFERIGERLERRINEVAEMQRLSEERFRAEWNDWTEEDQRKWKEFTVGNDESWRVHNREMLELRNSLKETSERLDPLHKSLDRIWKLQRAQAELYRERYQALLIEYDKPQETLYLGVVGDNGSS